MTNNYLKIKWGLGSIRKTGQSIKLYHVVNPQGVRMATCRTEQDAKNWIADYYEHNPTKRHGGN